MSVGEVREWPIRTVSKTVVLKGTVGSNPTLSANQSTAKSHSLPLHEIPLTFPHVISLILAPLPLSTSPVLSISLPQIYEFLWPTFGGPISPGNMGPENPHPIMTSSAKSRVYFSAVPVLSI